MFLLVPKCSSKQLNWRELQLLNITQKKNKLCGEFKYKPDFTRTKVSKTFWIESITK
jgi:hypothetical protein